MSAKAGLEKNVAVGLEKNVGVAHADQIFKQARINRRLLLINIWTNVGAFTYGFSAAIIASSLSQPNLFVYFRLADRPNETQVIGAIAALFNVGGLMGVFLIGWLQNRYGRKSSFAISSIASFLGASLASGSRNLTMLILGRFFTGVGAWGFMISAIVYSQELAPANHRGALGGSIGVALITGYITAAWAGYGFYFLNSPNNWRIALTIQLISPFLSLCGLPFVPESPRWLEAQGRSEDALRILKMIHATKQDSEDLVAREEHFQIRQQTELDKTIVSTWASMFTKYRRRTLCAILVPAANQFTGSNLLANFGPLLYTALGYSTPKSLIFQAGFLMTGCTFTCAAPLLVDRLGRVNMLVYSIVGASCLLAIEAALAAQVQFGTATRSCQAAAVAIIYLWQLFYAPGEPILYLYIGEIFPTAVRGKGVAVGLATINIMSIWVTMASPTAQANIGWKFYLIFVIPAFVLGILQYFVLPETANVPLEEISALFGEKDDVAVFASNIYVDSRTQEVTAAS